MPKTYPAISLALLACALTNNRHFLFQSQWAFETWLFLLHRAILFAVSLLEYGILPWFWIGQQGGPWGFGLLKNSTFLRSVYPKAGRFSLARINNECPLPWLTRWSVRDDLRLIDFLCYGRNLSRLQQLSQDSGIWMGKECVLRQPQK